MNVMRLTCACSVVTVLLLVLSGCDGGGGPRSCTVKTAADLALLKHTVIPTVVDMPS